MFLSSQDACIEALMVTLSWHAANWKAASQKYYNGLFSSPPTTSNNHFHQSTSSVLCFYKAENQVISRPISRAVNELAQLLISTFCWASSWRHVHLAVLLLIEIPFLFNVFRRENNPILVLLLVILLQCPVNCGTFCTEVIGVHLSSYTQAWTSTRYTNWFTFLSLNIIFYLLKMVSCLGAQSRQPPAHHK